MRIPKLKHILIAAGLLLLIGLTASGAFLYHTNTLQRDDVRSLKTCQGHTLRKYPENCKTPLEIHIRGCVTFSGHRNEKRFCKFLPEWLDADKRLTYTDTPTDNTIQIYLNIEYANGFRRNNFTLTRNNETRNYFYESLHPTLSPREIYRKMISSMERDFFQ